MLEMVNSFKRRFVMITLLTSIAATTALMLATITTDLTYVYGQAGTGAQNIKATYAVIIVPGASQKTNSIHYYPARIAVPVGTTVAWFNNDAGGRVYGPDFSSSGAYHLEAPFLKGNANYTLKVEIAAINGKQPQNKIMDGFSLRTIT